MDEQLAICWPSALNLLRAKAHPAHDQVFASCPLDYYWSVYQSEWATDVMFRDQRTLAELYQRLVHHGITRFQCRDVLRFLGKKLTADGSVRGNFAGEVTSDLKHRPEGIRLKHYVAGNSVKIYDKQGTVLRAETTINDPGGFKVYRTAEGDDDGQPTWRAMRKGVADMTRRTEVSQAVNDRYLDALASCEDTAPLGELTADVCRPVTWNGRRARALHPWSPDDLALLRARSCRLPAQRISQRRPVPGTPRCPTPGPRGAPPAVRRGHPQDPTAARPWPGPQAPQVTPVRSLPQGSPDHLCTACCLSGRHRIP
jgi:hypothetical protein